MTEFPLVLTLGNIFRYFDTFRSTTESPKIAGGYSRHRVSRHVQRACLTAGLDYQGRTSCLMPPDLVV